MMNPVRVSVVMPTCNDAPYLRQAIDSVLKQTYADFEFVIVNDGSTDETDDIIASYPDNRIRYFRNDKNYGNTYSRNKGMAQARGTYIAIMDSDDIMHSQRLARQVAYLEAHPEIDFLGSTLIRFSAGQGHYYQYFPHDPGYIRAAFLFRSLMMQPTITFRRERILEHKLSYNETYPVGGDYRFFFTATQLGLKFSSLAQPLLYYRVSDSQISRLEELHRHDDLIKTFFRERLSVFALGLDESEWEIFYRFTQTRIPMDREKFEKLTGIFHELEQRNKRLKLYAENDFAAALFFFRLRLIKYEFLEKGKKLRFAAELLRLIAKTGFQSTYRFWNNEGKYVNRSGEKHTSRNTPVFRCF